jgi:hypothetical protein
MMGGEGPQHKAERRMPIPDFSDKYMRFILYKIKINT